MGNRLNEAEVRDYHDWLLDEVKNPRMSSVYNQPLPAGHFTGSWYTRGNEFNIVGEDS